MRKLDRPNILLLYTDQQRRDSLGCYGSDWAVTPNLDRLAGEGARLGQYHVSNPVCMPSRMCSLTGRYPGSLGIGTNGVPLPADAVPVNQLLAPHGYATAQIGKLHFDPHANRDHREPTSDYGFGRFILSDEPGCYDDAYIEWVRSIAPDQVDPCRIELPPAARHQHQPEPPAPKRGGVGGYLFEGDEDLTHSAFVAAETCRFLEEAPADRPFFAIAGFYAPHSPLNPPKSCWDRIDPAKLPPPRMGEAERANSGLAARTTEEQWREMARYYYALCTHVDDCVGRILEALDKTGRTENTVVIFTSDHGEYLGDHGRIAKGPPAHDCIARVPMLVRYPAGIPAGTVAEGLAEGVDLAPTLLDYAGVRRPAYVQGRSFREMLAGREGTGKEDVLIDWFNNIGPGAGGGDARITTVKTDRWTYTCDSRGSELLYDRRADPHELEDLSGEAGHAKTVAEMRNRLLVRLQNCGLPGRRRIADY